MKPTFAFLICLCFSSWGFTQNDSAAVYNERAFASFNKNDFAGCFYWSEKLFATGLGDYRNNYNLYRASVSACQVNQPEKAVAYFKEMADKYLDYGNYPYFLADSVRIKCVSSKEIWRKAMAYMKPKYDSVQTVNRLYYEGITDTSRRLNRSALLDRSYLKKLMATSSFDKAYQTLKTYQQYDIPPVLGHWTLYHLPVNDTLSIPFLVYIPKRYDPAKKAPLYVFLHGAVRGRLQFAVRANIPHYDKNVLEKPIQSDAFIIYPFARKDLNWLYHALSFQIIQQEIAMVKSLYNINDDRVSVAGHSNGGEGVFYLAVNQPTTFASFLAFNYFPESWITNTSLRNLRNKRMLYGVSGTKDHLFTYSKVDSIYRYAKERGCNWQNYAFDKDHMLAYSSPNLTQAVFDTLLAKQRHPFAKEIIWEADRVGNGRCDWIEITRLDTLAPKAVWAETYNPSVTGKDSRAPIRLNKNKSGIIQASIQGNHVRIQTSCVGEFSFYVYPELVDTSRPIIFTINEKKVYTIKPVKSKQDLEEAFAQFKDRTLLPFQKITLSIPK